MHAFAYTTARYYRATTFGCRDCKALVNASKRKFGKSCIILTIAFFFFLRKWDEVTVKQTRTSTVKQMYMANTRVHTCVHTYMRTSYEYIAASKQRLSTPIAYCNFVYEQM